MQETYLIVKYDYETGKEEVQNVCTDKFNALNEIQSMVVDYIQKKDGVEKISSDAKCTDSKALENYVYSVKELGTSYCKIEKSIETKPIGHYVVVDSDDHLHKWTIWQKYVVTKTVKGYWGPYEQSTPKSRKVFDLDVVQFPLSMFKLLFRTYRKRCVETLVDKLEIEDTEARSLWRSFTDDLEKTPVFKALKDVDDLKVAKLRADFPGEFHKYTKKIAVSCTTSVSREDSRANPMYMSLMNELTSTNTEELEEENEDDFSCQFVAPVLEAGGNRGPNVLLMLQKKLADEALNGKSKLKSSPKNVPVIDTDENYVKPPWMGRRASSS